MKTIGQSLQDRRDMPSMWVALLFGAASILLLAGTGRAQQDLPALESEPSWIVLSGTVESVRRDQFTLDYGGGNIVVEMDDGDRDADAYRLYAGDEVAVAGRIDDDFFGSTSIEAASVYVENIRTTFFASPRDTEGLELTTMTVVAEPIDPDGVIRGRVTAVLEDSFMLDTGPRRLRVDVSALEDNPVDEIGYQRIDVGDRVQVTGDIDEAVFEGRGMIADSVIELYTPAEPADTS